MAKGSAWWACMLSTLCHVLQTCYEKYLAGNSEPVMPHADKMAVREGQTVIHSSIRQCTWQENALCCCRQAEAKCSKVATCVP